MPKAKDFYELLGVARDATDQEIRKAYLKLAHLYHPDKTGGDKVAEDKLKEINAAYDTLKNKEKRARYDQFGGQESPFGGFNSGAGFDTPFEDFFDVLFGRGGGGGRGGRRSAPGNDLEYRVNVTLREAAKGVHKTVRFQRLEVCGDCSGSGASPGTQPEACSHCGGVGQVRMTQGFFSVTRPCPRCRGTGRVVSSPCTRCSGAGRVQLQRELSLDIPPGVDSGSRLRVSGEGEPGIGGGARGDLFIHIEVEEDEIFVREGNNVICNIPISFTQAALGATLRVPTLDGEAELKIPEGTQSGTPFRLRGKGIPDIRGYSRGDQVVRVQVETPRKLNKEQKELLHQFEELSNAKTYPIHQRFWDSLKRSFSGKPEA
jgi:molecular chaperone DnaJ